MKPEELIPVFLRAVAQVRAVKPGSYEGGMHYGYAMGLCFSLPGGEFLRAMELLENARVNARADHGSVWG